MPAKIQNGRNKAHLATTKKNKFLIFLFAIISFWVFGEGEIFQMPLGTLFRPGMP